MRSRTPPDLAGHCKRCTLNETICICDQVPLVRTRTQVVIVRHTAESRLTSNSGRLAHLALPSSLLLAHGGWSVPDSGEHQGQRRGVKVDEDALHAEGSVLLYGAGDLPSKRPLDFVPQRLIVLDGSYRQARRMYKSITKLRGVPELCLPAPSGSVQRLRRAPKAGSMATLEAIAHALDLLEGSAVGAPLHALYAEFVRRMRALRGHPRSRY